MDTLARKMKPFSLPSLRTRRPFHHPGTLSHDPSACAAATKCSQARPGGSWKLAGAVTRLGVSRQAKPSQEPMRRVLTRNLRHELGEKCRRNCPKRVGFDTDASEETHPSSIFMASQPKQKACAMSSISISSAHGGSVCTAQGSKHHPRARVGFLRKARGPGPGARGPGPGARAAAPLRAVEARPCRPGQRHPPGGWRSTRLALAKATHRYPPLSTNRRFGLGSTFHGGNSHKIERPPRRTLENGTSIVPSQQT